MAAKVEKGGSGGLSALGLVLGAALARPLRTGYKVALIARSADIIEKVLMRSSGSGIAYPIQSDATIEGQIAATHAQIRRETGSD